jgi:CRISPR-associated protein Csc1
MRLYQCQLEIHENLFYATREMGRLYECEAHLHNYALTYALGLASAPYFQATQVPSYQEELTPLNERGLYVTPAAPLMVAYDLATFKYASNDYHVEMGKARTNIPSFGRAKELAVGSRFEFAILSQSEDLAHSGWLRLGLWRSKAQVHITEHEMKQTHLEGEVLPYPLNPLDLPTLEGVQLYDLVSMRPTSLLVNARYSGPAWRSLRDPRLVVPDGLAYRFP